MALIFLLLNSGCRFLQVWDNEVLHQCNIVLKTKKLPVNDPGVFTTQYYWPAENPRPPSTFQSDFPCIKYRIFFLFQFFFISPSCLLAAAAIFHTFSYAVITIVKITISLYINSYKTIEDIYITSLLDNV